MSNEEHDDKCRLKRVEELQQRALRMREQSEIMLQSMCQFLALRNEDKLRFLPEMKAEVTYALNEAGDRTDNPLLYYCNAVYELTDRYRGTSERGFADIIGDISALLGVMIEQAGAYPWIWRLDKEEYGICGPADRLWNVLRRLSEQALMARHWSCEAPGIPFCEVGQNGLRRQ